MSNRGASHKALIIRLALLIVIGAGVVLFVASRRPTQVSEEEVRAIIAGKELIGMPMGRAAERLQHRAGYVEEGMIICDFEQFEGWGAGPVVLEIAGGMVTKAYWQKDVAGKPGEK